eukprot:SAG31_NODE_4459_length_3214_cov_7.582986_2_plen_153_part_00
MNSLHLVDINRAGHTSLQDRERVNYPISLCRSSGSMRVHCHTAVDRGEAASSSVAISACRNKTKQNKFIYSWAIAKTFLQDVKQNKTNLSTYGQLRITFPDRSAGGRLSAIGGTPFCCGYGSHRRRNAAVEAAPRSRGRRLCRCGFIGINWD